MHKTNYKLRATLIYIYGNILGFIGLFALVFPFANPGFVEHIFGEAGSLMLFLFAGVLFFRGIEITSLGQNLKKTVDILTAFQVYLERNRCNMQVHEANEYYADKLLKIATYRNQTVQCLDAIFDANTAHQVGQILQNTVDLRELGRFKKELQEHMNRRYKV